MVNHYKYLERVLPGFFAAVGVSWEGNRGIIVAHGDKFYSYRDAWEKAGLTFCQGAAIAMLTYVYPYGKECRETPDGWVAPVDWVVANKERFIHLLPKE
jgi:hypothetical protein